MNKFPFELGVNKVPMGGTGNCYTPNVFTGGKKNKINTQKGRGSNDDPFDFASTQRWQEDQNKAKQQRDLDAARRDWSIRTASPERQRQTVEDANRTLAQLGQRQIYSPPVSRTPEPLPSCPYECRPRQNFGGKKISANNRNNKMVNNKDNKDNKDNKNKNAPMNGGKSKYHGGDDAPKNSVMPQQMGGKKDKKDNNEPVGGMGARRHYGGDDAPQNPVMPQQMGGKKDKKDNNNQDGGEIELGGGKYKVRLGPRGGKYVLRLGKKVYLNM